MYLVDKNNKNDVVGTGTVQGGGTPPLGNIAKSTTPSMVVDEANRQRRKKYELLSSIRKCFLAQGKIEGLDIAHKYHRTTNCKHSLFEEYAHIHKSEVTQRSYYTGLQTCGSVWTCPICAGRIQEVRRLEIAHTMKYFYSVGKQAVMITFTFPHNADDELKALLNNFSKALSAFKSGKPWERFKEKIGFEGLIRSLEITHGVNGWHPHTHELFFINSSVNEQDFRNWIIKRWLKMCLNAKLLKNDSKKVEAFIEHAVDIKFNCKTSDYLAKFDDKTHWGIDRELAKASTKKGRAKGLHPFELAHQNYFKLFLEYANAIKGKRQIFFSKGLKEKVKLQDLKDEQIAEREEAPEDLYIGALSSNAWHIVKNKELRCDVLEMAEAGNSIKNIRSFIFNSEAVKNE